MSLHHQLRPFGNADDREIAAPAFVAMKAIMKLLSDFCATLARKYENLFKRRFHIENEEALCECIATDPPQRNRYRIAGSIFPTAPILPRYQY